MNTKAAHSFAWTQGKADIALGLVAVAWGSSYLLMKIGLGGMGPFMVIAMRFLIAFAVVGAVSFRKIAHTNRAVLKYASVLGLLLFGLFAFLTHGLETTSASNGGFLTAMAVVFVPIINAALQRRIPPRPIIAGTLVTLAGIALLSLRGGLELHPGDALCLAGALLYAVFIVATDRLAPGIDGMLLGTWQLGFAGLYGLVFSLVCEVPTLPQTPAQWGAIFGARHCVQRIWICVAACCTAAYHARAHCFAVLNRTGRFCRAGLFRAGRDASRARLPWCRTRGDGRCGGVAAWP